METADAERRELLERRGREVDGAGPAARAGVCDGDNDGLLAVRDAHLASAHGVAVACMTSASGRLVEKGRSGKYVLVGVRARTREVLNGRVVDSDNEVGRDVVVAARSDARRVEGGCANEVNEVVSMDGRQSPEHTITARLGHLNLGEGDSGGRESDEEGGGGEAHVERKRE